MNKHELHYQEWRCLKSRPVETHFGDGSAELFQDPLTMTSPLLYQRHPNHMPINELVQCT